MHYKMNCPMCQKEMMAMADDETEGMTKMKEEVMSHMKSAHPDAGEEKTDEEMEKMIQESWTTEEM